MDPKWVPDQIGVFLTVTIYSPNTFSILAEYSLEMTLRDELKQMNQNHVSSDCFPEG